MSPLSSLSRLRHSGTVSFSPPLLAGLVLSLKAVVVLNPLAVTNPLALGALWLAALRLRVEMTDGVKGKG